MTEEELRRTIARGLDLEGFSDPEQDEIIKGLIESVVELAQMKFLDDLSPSERGELALLSETAYYEKLRAFLLSADQRFMRIIEDASKEVIAHFNSLRHSK